MSKPITERVTWVTWTYLRSGASPSQSEYGCWHFQRSLTGFLEVCTHLVISHKSRKGWNNRAGLRLLNQRVCYFLSDHSWLKFHQIIWLLALSPVSPHSRLGRGAACLSLGPMAILDQVKGLAHLYSIILRAFVYFKDRKMRNFGEMDGLWDLPQW